MKRFHYGTYYLLYPIRNEMSLSRLSSFNRRPPKNEIIRKWEETYFMDHQQFI